MLFARTSVLATAAMMAVGSLASAATLYSDDFQSGSGNSANYSVNAGPGTNAANFAFDYSTLGIPKAPHTTDNSTVGLQLTANTANIGATGTGAVTGLSVSPLGKSFTGDYVLQVDAWANYGGSGTTEVLTYGIGNNVTSAEYAGAANGLLFATTGDGGSSSDYRVYPASGTQLDPAGGNFAAGTVNDSSATDARQASNSYYTSKISCRDRPCRTNR